jgi:hypothetical protein
MSRDPQFPISEPSVGGIQLEIPKIDKTTWNDFLHRGEDLMRDVSPDLYSAALFRFVGFLDKLFQGQYQGRKIIDVAAGAGLKCPPVLAEFLARQGAQVLAIDQNINPDEGKGFATARIDLADFYSEQLPPEWQQADLVISTAFLGVPSHDAGIDPLQLLLELFKIAKLQVHSISEPIDVSYEFSNKRISQVGLEVVYNGINDPQVEKEVENRFLIVKNKEH